MPDSKTHGTQPNEIKLWYAYIGGTEPGKKIEAHDVVFGFGTKAEDIYPLVEKSWKGIKNTVHIDCIGPLLSADGYNITLESEPQSPCASYFIKETSEEQLKKAISTLDKAYIYMQKEQQLGWLYVEKGEILKSFEVLEEKADQKIIHILEAFNQKDELTQEPLVLLKEQDLELITTVTGHAPAYKNRLFFVNLGGYLPGVFAESHENVIIVAPNEVEAKNRALKAIKPLNFKSAHRDFVHDVEYDADQLTDLTKLLNSQSDKLYVHLHPTDAPRPFEYVCKYTPLRKPNESIPSSQERNVSLNPFNYFVTLENPETPSYKTSLTASFAFGALGLFSYVNGNNIEATAAFLACAAAAKIAFGQAGFNAARLTNTFNFFTQTTSKSHQEQQSLAPSL
ncbi:MAG: DUF1543 domain-containing protein [Legionella sp.]|uniref:DUF1543 domain-containing protein n=1 Tax=Legionella sp. TaxID=459 RepID=UPI00284C19C7|nr:DUF1543 domain-containing protein [Legionella sp.]